MHKKYIFFIFNLFFNITHTNNISDLPYPYNTLSKLLPFDNHGWYSNGTYLSKLITTNNVKTVIEIGSWLGLSTRHIASLLPEDGKVYAVDTWLGSEENYKETHNVHRLPILYEQFLSNIIHAQLTHKIIPHRMLSTIAAKILSHLKNKVDLIYIDAGHDKESVLQDLHAWFPYIKNNSQAILCGDDWKWAAGVREAVKIFTQQYNLTIYYGDNFWFIKNTGIYKQESFLNADESIWIFQNYNN